MDKIKFFIIKFFSIIFFSSPFAYAQIMPNNTDLKSAYCLESLKSDLVPSINRLIELFENWAVTGSTVEERLSAREQEKQLRLKLEKTYQDMHRLRSYLFPRINGMDVRGLELASNRAEEDNKLVKSCSSKCAGNPNPNPDATICFNSCLKIIGNPDERMKACQRIDFLPF